MSQSKAPDSQPSGILLDNEMPEAPLSGAAEGDPNEAASADVGAQAGVGAQAIESLAERDTPPERVTPREAVAEGLAIAETATAGGVLADAAASEGVAEATPEATPEADAENVSVGVVATFERVLAVLRARAQEWAQGIQFPPSPRTIRLLAAACSGLLLLALLPTLLNASRHSAGATSAPPTPTLVPTATPPPSPTAMTGYQPLVDSADGFVIQYPLAWTCATSNPGIDCIDSPSAQNFRLQVQLPGGWTGADTGKNPGDASVWVDYALSAFSDVPGRTYQRLSDANQPATIGGVVWQGGAAVVGIEPDDGSSDATATPTPPLALIRVQVYATLYNNRPYIIALYAADAQFSAGSARYFQPMLNSFAFLPTSHDS